ncbi:hypothetical protein HMPREF0083_03013 [Aneurinibacillus aneurinilyticus ATCC 12856]|uniref:Uncharacterized protein n=1 Tax=Aneurinibacillus aneurinilyticus ATCC 12856 TaxID=649747 RepID=U1YDQ1_ANEAE|nr:hypothetical protein HMPREF0083_03013 [Aneurinibacillus aneurinilyticus ATCC 12856]
MIRSLSDFRLQFDQNIRQTNIKIFSADAGGKPKKGEKQSAFLPIYLPDRIRQYADNGRYDHLTFLWIQLGETKRAPFLIFVTTII